MSKSRAYSGKRARGMNGLRGNEYYSEMRGCAGKTSFPSRRVAKARATIIERGGTFLRSYKCPHCGSWHLASRKAPDA